MTAYVMGPRTVSAERDENTYRSFMVTHVVRTDDYSDGPFVVMNCPTLPQMGDTWRFGNDSDIWAWCYPTMKVRILDEKEGEPTRFWAVEQKFSTQPLHRCMDTQVTDPLQEPQKISGSFVKYTRPVRFDRFGTLLTNSAWEPLNDSDVEFDANRPQVKIEQNVRNLDLPNITRMVDTVNAYTLWDLPRRCIKLSDLAWERKLYGTCNYYFTRSFTFDINFQTWDRPVLDAGTKVLKGKWLPPSPGVLPTYVPNPTADRGNPNHFQQYVDVNGQPGHVLLDGRGLPANSLIKQQVGTGAGAHIVGTGTYVSGEVNVINIQYYSESDFTVLNIPTSFV